MARKKQTFIPGTEPESHPDIDRAAELYVDARDERCRLSKEEAEAQDNLLETMLKHGLSTYEFDGKIVVALSKTKIVVKTKKDKANGDEG